MDMKEKAYDAFYGMEEFCADDLPDGNDRELLRGIMPSCVPEGKDQNALYAYLKGDLQKARRLVHKPLFWLMQCEKDYDRGEYGTVAQEAADVYEEASMQGYVRVMMRAKMLEGNCFLWLDRYEEMKTCYGTAERIASALIDYRALQALSYNRAIAQMMQGEYEEAWKYFRDTCGRDLLHMHKYLLCCEKTGRVSAALDAWERTAGLPDCLEKQMCLPLVMRMKDSSARNTAAYRELMRQLAEDLSAGRPHSYLLFLKRFG